MATEVEIMQRSNLTPRQERVWMRICIDGWSSPMVANELHIEDSTVRWHLMCAKTRINQTRELMQGKRAEHVPTHIPADKDCQPGLPTDYTNQPLAACMHAATRSYIHMKRKEQDEAQKKAEDKRLKKLHEKEEKQEIAA
jgi:hypothetical protein